MCIRDRPCGGPTHRMVIQAHTYGSLWYFCVGSGRRHERGWWQRAPDGLQLCQQRCCAPFSFASGSSCVPHRADRLTLLTPRHLLMPSDHHHQGVRCPVAVPTIAWLALAQPACVPHSTSHTRADRLTHRSRHAICSCPLIIIISWCAGLWRSQPSHGHSSPYSRITVVLLCWLRAEA